MGAASVTDEVTLPHMMLTTVRKNVNFMPT